MGNKTSVVCYADEYSFVEPTSVTVTSKNRPAELTAIKLTPCASLSALKSASPESFKTAFIDPDDIYYVTLKANIKYHVRAGSWAWIAHQSKSVADLADLVLGGRYTDDDYLKQDGYIVQRKLVGDLPIGKTKLVSPSRSFSMLKTSPGGQLLVMALFHDKSGKVHFCDVTRIARNQAGGEAQKTHFAMGSAASTGLGEAKATLAPSDPTFGEKLLRHKKSNPKTLAHAPPSPVSLSNPPSNTIQSSTSDNAADQSNTSTEDRNLITTLQVLVIVEFVVILVLLCAIVYQRGHMGDMQDAAGTIKVEL